MYWCLCRKFHSWGISILKRTAATMTVEEFKNELRRIREKALRITTKVGTRQDRSYRNQKRGNFYGN